MGTRRLLTPDDVTQPRIRECLERLLNLTITTLREQNLLADLPRDFEIVAERMDPEVPEVFYFVSQSLRRVINYAYDCPCTAIPNPNPNPNPTVTHSSHPPEQCPNPKLSTFYFSPPPPTPPVNFMAVLFFYITFPFFFRVGEDARDAFLDALGLIPYAHHRVASTRRS
jgi:hypothetical protein